MRQTDPVTELKGVGKKTEEAFARLQVTTVGDLIRYYPARYDSFGPVTQLAQADSGQVTAVRVRLVTAPQLGYAGKLPVLTVKGEDGTGQIRLTWFRMPYLRSQLKRGQTVLLRGRLVRDRYGIQMDQPRIYSEEEYARLQRTLQPVYRTTEGLTDKKIAKSVSQALEDCEDSPEFLPEEILARQVLVGERKALGQIHFPENSERLLAARRRLVFDEFLLFLLAVRKLRGAGEWIPNDLPIPPGPSSARLLDSLPYELTGAQKRVLAELRADLSGPHRMNRLVQGDVGSGKTILALLILLDAADAGYQGALMAPTEVLARQHYEKIAREICRLGLPCRAELLTGSLTAAGRRAAYRRIENHEVDLVIGTHALIQKGVVYDNLGLVITDEQHRFGVRQREALSKKGGTPHMLVMSATPIPRSLALILYGDMDLSAVNELPGNRIPIKNCVVDTSWRPKAYEFIRKEVSAGRQAYVICPLVTAGEGSDSEGENVGDYAEKLRAALPPAVRVETLHGRMRPAEKNRRMEAFAAGEIDVLVSTTVVEVGVDVPNATVMMIENAESYGLAQLHQLRGRVGRGEYPSYCIFVDTSGDPEKRKRLEILNHSNDGFQIASEDLKLRGPGDVFGIRQSGELSFGIGDIYADSAVLAAAAEEADRLLAEDPELADPEHRLLAQRLAAYRESSFDRLYL